MKLFRQNYVVMNQSLEWWKYHEHSYPKLSHIAKWYLGVVATSVPSERLFSTAHSQDIFSKPHIGICTMILKKCLTGLQFFGFK